MKTLRISGSLLAVALSTCGWAQKYTITSLGYLGTSYGTEACAINNLGQAAGYENVPPLNNVHAILWSPSGAKQDLGTLPAFVWSEAMAINNLSTVVGFLSGGMVQAFKWSSSSGITLVPILPGAISGYANGINDLGQVVGSCGYSDYSHRAFLSNVDGSVVDIGVVGTSDIYSVATAINNSGQVVGMSTSNTSGYAGQAFYWDSVTGIHGLGTLAGDTISYAYAMNNVGQVVGYSNGSNGASPVMWTIGGGIKSLGAVGVAYGINDAGTVVGSTYGSQAWVWKQATGVKDLNTMISASTPGWYLGEAFGINSKGQIVGVGGYNGQTCGFIATPMPGTTVSGSVAFSDYGSSTPATANFAFEDSGNNVLYTVSNVTLDSTGKFNFQAPAGDVFYVSVQVRPWLRRTVGPVDTSVDVSGLLLNLIDGDCDGSNAIDLGDYIELAAAYGSFTGDANFDKYADLNGDTQVDIGDYLVLAKNYGSFGDN